jgi:AraC-like DNA-binding protein
MPSQEREGHGWLKSEQEWADMVYVFLLARVQAMPVETRHAANYISWFEHEMARLDPKLSGLFYRLGEPQEMARSAGYSSRQLRRLQRNHAGLSPKSLHRIIRFQQLLASLQCGGEIETFGYSDQAHAIREFRQFTGMTPTYYVRHFQYGRNILSE